jgi:23S rRNA pseudouridine1911/1915/1917 synthase
MMDYLLAMPVTSESPASFQCPESSTDRDTEQTPGPCTDHCAALAGPADAGMRLDVFWVARLAHRDVARARIQDWIQSGLARVAGQICTRPARRLQGMESCTLDVPIRTGALRPENRSLRVLYRDDDLVILNKQAGLVMHPGPGRDEGTLVHRLVHHFPELATLPGARPGIVHRLDKDTTGLLVVALNEPVRLKLTAAFARREVDKVYLALVYGRPSAQGIVTAALGRHPTLKTRMAVDERRGRQARSEYAVLWTAPQDRFSLVQVRIRTGRTHQVRVHMRHIGHSLLGDGTYGPARVPQWPAHVPNLAALLTRPMLHAWKLGFVHPRSQKNLDFHLPPPKDMWRVMLAGARTTQRVGLTGMPGCGKSALLGLLREAGIPVWSADAAINALYQPGQEGWELIRQRYGQRFIPETNAPVDKQALFSALRASAHFRREFEAMIHPVAAHSLECFWAGQRAARLAVAEVPLLLETGWESDFDVVVGLACDSSRRNAWLRNRGWDQSLLADVESWQWPEAKKLGSCDLVVDNPGNWDDLHRRAHALLRVLQWLRRRKVHGLHARIFNLIQPATKSDSASALPPVRRENG